MKIFKVFVDLFDRRSLVRFELLCRIAKMLVPHYRFKWPQMAWWDNVFFNAYLKRFDEHDGMNTDRRWMQYQLSRLVVGVPGDTAECGAFKGAASWLICKVNKENKKFNRNHHIFDSFEGLSEPGLNDGIHWVKGDLSFSEDAIKKNLKEFQCVSYYKGWIPERFDDVRNVKFCFVHIDVDLYQPTLDSLEFFYERLNDGGIIICDDYGFTTCPGVTKAVDEFFLDKPEKMISMSGGGGFFIKGVESMEVLEKTFS